MEGKTELDLLPPLKSDATIPCKNDRSTTLYSKACC